MKTIKFTKDNLVRHLDADPDNIYTIRNAPKEEVNHLVNIDGAGTYLLVGIAKFVGRNDIFYNLFPIYYTEMGFESESECYDEIRNIYGNITNETKLYLHHLVRIREFNRGIPVITLAKYLKENYSPNTLLTTDQLNDIIRALETETEK